MRRAAVAALLLGLSGTQGLADDSADILFWNSVKDSRSPAQFQAYLNAFPEGKFAPLARIRIGAGATVVPAAPRGATSPPPDTPPAVSSAAVRVDPPLVRAVDRIAVDIDARGLRDGSNNRAIVVPAGTPDALDPEILAALGTPIEASRLRLTLPPGAPGEDEVRIYTILPFGRAFVVAARAPVTVSPAPEGATIVAELAGEAAAIGAVAFEARYRDRPLRLAGQFLRMTSETTSPDLLAMLRGADATGTKYVALYLGHLGTPDSDAGRSEAACLVSADDQATLDRLAALSPGDEVVVEGKGSTWGAGRGREFVVLDPCRLAQ